MTGIERGLELHSIADLPANSGLGLSSAFTVALVNGLHAYRREFVATEQLAREACQIEIDILKEPIGKQDQYISAYGGITAFTFEPGGGVTVERVPWGWRWSTTSRSNLLVFYSGIERKASDVRPNRRRPSREQGRRGRADAPHQGARLRDQAHPADGRHRHVRRDARTSTGRTSASSASNMTDSAPSTSTTRPRARRAPSAAS